MENQINLEVLAKVMGVYSVSHAKQFEEDLKVTYRQEEDDNSTWAALSIYELADLYKGWVLETYGYDLVSYITREYDTTLGYCLVYQRNASWEDETYCIHAESEQKAIRLATEWVHNNVNIPEGV